MAVTTLAAVAHPEELEERYPRVAAAWEEQGHVETDAGAIGFGFLEDAKTHDVRSAVSILRAPVLVLHGEDDEALIAVVQSANFSQVDTGIIYESTP